MTMQTSSVRKLLVASIASCSVLVAALGVALVTAGAASAVDSTVDPAGHIVVNGEPDPAEWTDVEPGDVLNWRINIGLQGARSGALALQFVGHGPLVAEGLIIEADACLLSGNAAGHCVEPAKKVFVESLAPDSSSAKWELGQVTATNPMGLFVTLTVPETATVTAGRTTIGIGVFATGESSTPVRIYKQLVDTGEGSPPEQIDKQLVNTTENSSPERIDTQLAYTGVNWRGLLLMGLGLAGLGIAAGLARSKPAS